MLKAVSELREQVYTLYEPAGHGVWEKKLWTTAAGKQNIGNSLLLQVSCYSNLCTLSKSLPGLMT